MPSLKSLTEYRQKQQLRSEATDSILGWGPDDVQTRPITNTFLDQARDEQPLAISVDQIDPELLQYQHEKLNAMLEFFLNPQPKHEKFSHYVNNPGDWKLHKAQVFAAAYRKYQLEAQERGTEALSMADFFNLLSSRYQDEQLVHKELSLRERIMNDEQYERAIDNTKDALIILVLLAMVVYVIRRYVRKLMALRKFQGKEKVKHSNDNSPLMSVGRYNYFTRKVECSWFDTNGNFHSQWINQDELTRYDDVPSSE
jgi:hypothetical protein